MTINMQGYKFDPSKSWAERLAPAKAEFEQHYGTTPAVAWVHVSWDDAPEMLDGVEIELNPGPLENHIYLGPVPGDQVPPVEQAADHA